MNRIFYLLLFFLFSCSITAQKEQSTPNATWKTFPGFYNFHYDENNDKIMLEISEFKKEFLLVYSLAAGVGSNDIGLDRGRINEQKVVRFEKHGKKIFLIQSNYSYRAISDNAAERKAVKDAFAESVLHSFKIHTKKGEAYYVDLTKFLLQDSYNGNSSAISWAKQGSYSVDAARSAIYLDGTLNFPNNTEFEAILTLKGKPQGGFIRSVVPTPNAVSLRQHISFIKLPDNSYSPRKFLPNSGFFYTSFYDYATPIDQPLSKKYINRHRLIKKNPGAAVSEAVDPIIYYLDPGTPEPIRSALLDGAQWWNQAFVAAGFINAFQVKMLPENVHPMDVRYNTINWVHRSTRGWSYGGSISDPRTGEIIKGNVILGSLRVRQDYLIALGLAAPYGKNQDESSANKELIEMALARLRQLSAHEVGHTIGVAHNFAASTDSRSSVMDYPHPIISFAANKTDFSNAYDTKIGAWDKRAIVYGYSTISGSENEALMSILKETSEMGLDYISDRDARPQGGMHPLGHLWDNGTDAVSELKRISSVRNKALNKLGENALPKGMPGSYLEDVLVPLYLSHRYQVEAAAKIIAGVHYNYGVKGEGLPNQKMVLTEKQNEALKAILKTLSPEFLEIPSSVLELISPQPPGYSKGREHFKGKTGLAFDPVSAAEGSASHSLKLLLNAQRINRLSLQHGGNSTDLNPKRYFDLIGNELFNSSFAGMHKEIALAVQNQFLNELFRLAQNGQASVSTKSAVYDYLKLNATRLVERNGSNYLKSRINSFLDKPEVFNIPKTPELPAGSPIGCGHIH